MVETGVAYCSTTRGVTSKQAASLGQAERCLGTHCLGRCSRCFASRIGWADDDSWATRFLLDVEIETSFNSLQWPASKKAARRAASLYVGEKQGRRMSRTERQMPAALGPYSTMTRCAWWMEAEEDLGVASARFRQSAAFY